MKNQKTAILIVVLVLIVGSIYYLEVRKVTHPSDAEIVEVAPRVQTETSTETQPKEETKPAVANTKPVSTPGTISKAEKYPLAKEITTPNAFINTDGKPIKISDYVGKKVILVDFWTYSCINCVRTTPFLNAWWTKYKDNGLVIVGIHTPEFDFEKDYDNVKKATADLGIQFPVVIDNDFSTWTAYGNNYWPRKYLIDIDGYVVYDHIGEGAYDQTEKKIQELLEERSRVLNLANEMPEKDISKPTGVVTVEAQSPETYFGSLRNSTLANGDKGLMGVQTFQYPEVVTKNLLYLSGKWDIRQEYAESQSNDSKIIFKYKAKKVYFVASSDEGIDVNLKIDGKAAGSVNIKDSGLYTLVSHDTVEEHTLEITIPEGKLKAFTFTFG